MSLQQTILNIQPELSQRADLVKKDFDQLVADHGRRVVLETALMCPCKSKDTNQQSNCRNCGGTGWVFINPRITRMVLQGMDAVQKYVGWSEELRGMVNVSCVAEEELSNMDRITAVDGISIHQEVLFVKQSGSTKFAYAAYRIKKIKYIAKFSAVDQKLVRLTEGTDYTISGNAILFLTPVLDDSITVRYSHAPTFHVIEMKRDTMQSFRMTTDGEVNQNMPLAAYARRAHYALDQTNLAQDRILDNSYIVPCPVHGIDAGCGCSGGGGMDQYNIIQNTVEEFNWNQVDW